MAEGAKFEQPTTLKECLRLLGSLNENNTDVRTQVIEKLYTSLSLYCNSSYLASFHTSGSSNAYLSATFKGADALLSSILYTVTYGEYNNISGGCVPKIAMALQACLPKVFAVLYFLYFNTVSFGIDGSGQWSGQKLRGSEGKNALYNWLTDQTSETGLIKTGFQNDLFKSMTKEDDSRSTSGDILATTALDSLVHHKDAAALQNALLGLVFLGPWHDSKLGHAVLFLDCFCDKVDSQESILQQKFNNQMSGLNWSAFQHACRNLRPCLEIIVDGAYSMIQAVCWQNSGLYTSVWDPEKFPMYIDWIWKHLYDIIASLHNMLKDSTKWRKTRLRSVQTAGPFKYGLVFKEGWDEKSSSIQLRGYILTLIQALLKLLRPTTLKSCLQLMAKLSTLSDLGPKVISKLKEQVKKYCGSEYLRYFCNPRTSSGYLINAFQRSNALVIKILKSNPYGPYSSLPVSQSEYLATWCSGIIIDMLPQCYAALYFLYYITYESLKNTIRGGQWSGQTLQDSGPLKNWLTDQPKLTTGLNKRGFLTTDQFQSGPGPFKPGTTGLALGNVLALVIHHSSGGGELQKALLGMLFICPWDHSLTGHALCFLCAFCSRASTLMSEFLTTVPGGVFSKFKDVSAKLNTSLQPFVGHYAILSAVCWSNEHLYDSVWDAGQFDKYVEWLKENNILSKLKDSLQSMLKDSTNWDEDKLKLAKTAGPFRYGFVFKDGWNGNSQGQRLQKPINTLTDSLQSLAYILDPIYNAIYNGAQVGLTAAEIGAVEIGLAGLGLGLEIIDKTLERAKEEKETLETGKGEEEEEAPEKNTQENGSTTRPGSRPEPAGEPPPKKDDEEDEEEKTVEESANGEDEPEEEQPEKKTPNPKTPVKPCTIIGGVLTSLGFPAIGAMGYGAIRLLP